MNNLEDTLTELDGTEMNLETFKDVIDDFFRNYGIKAIKVNNEESDME